MTASTFDPSNTGGTLSNGNLTFTQTSATWKGTKSTTNTFYNGGGKLYAEVKLNGGAASIGFGLATFDYNAGTKFMGEDINGFGWNSAGNIYTSNSNIFTAGTYTTNDIIMLAVDTATTKVWWGKNGVWLNSGNPTVGTGNITTISGTPFIGVTTKSSGGSVTVNFGMTPFSYSPPTGFTAWGPVDHGIAMALTETSDTFDSIIHLPRTDTWDPAKKDSAWALTSGNLVGQHTSVGGNQMVFATGSRSSTKRYFEVLVNTPGTSHCIGLANSSQTLNTYVGSSVNSWSYNAPGNKIHNVTQTAVGSGFTNGQYVGVAVDLDAGNLWFSVNGTWVSGDPATGSSPAYTGVTGTLFPVMSGADADKGTFNAGATSFHTAAPTGFTGWGIDTPATDAASIVIVEGQDAANMAGTFLSANACVIIATESQDTAALVGTFFGPVTGTIAVIDAPDTVSLAGTSVATVTIALATSGPQDTFASSFTVQGGAIPATLTGVDNPDVFYSTGGSQVVTKKFVACGINAVSLGQISSSEDGVVWTGVANLGNKVNSIFQAGANGLWVAVGKAGSVGALWTSPDLAIWTLQTLPSSPTELTAVHWNGSLWVACSLTGQHYYSADAITWTLAYTSSFQVRDVYYSTRWVSVGINNKFWYSSNAISWTPGVFPSTIVSKSVTFNNGVWVAVGAGAGSNGAIYTSVDGIVWALRDSSAVANTSVDYGNGRWCATASVAPSTSVIKTSTNSTTWTSSTLSTSTGLLQGLAHNGTKWCAVGFKSFSAASPVYVSTDGISWFLTSYPGNHNLLNVTVGTFNGASYVTGALAVTDPQDIFVAGATTGGPHGSLIATEAQDTFALHGFHVITATLNMHVTENTDVGAFASVIVLPDNPATLTGVETPDTFSSSGISVVLRNVVFIAALENEDSVALHASVPTRIALAATEDQDVALFTQAGSTLALKLSSATADQFTTLDATVWDGGTLNIYSGSQPTDPDDAPSGTLLGSIPLPTPAFGPLVAGQATQLDPWTGAATGNGVAGWFRLFDSTGDYSIDGSAGTSNADLIMSTSVVAAGDPLVVTAAFFQLLFLNA